MDQNYLDELKRLKEQKSADLDRLQEAARMNVPNLEDDSTKINNTPVSAQPVEESAPVQGSETIQFEPVTPPAEAAKPTSGGRRGRQPSPEERKKMLRKKKKKKIVLLTSIFSSLALIAALVVVFFAVRNANIAKVFNEYWGLGLNLENGVSEYDFFGNIKSITRFDAMGLPQFVAEFEDGNCVRETKFDANGNVLLYYLHQYERDERIFSAYFEGGQMVISERYERIDAQTVHAERTYHTGEVRSEEGFLTIVNGKLTQREVVQDDVVILREKYEGTLILQSEAFDVTGQPVSKTVNEYDKAKKLLLKQLYYDADGTTLLRKTEYKYDERTNLVSEKAEYEDGVRTLYVKYNYDANNNPSNEVSYEKDGTIREIIEREFNDKNRVVKIISKDGNQNVNYCLGYDYDDNGYVTKAITYHPLVTTSIERYTIFERSETGALQKELSYNANSILVDKKIYGTSGMMAEHYLYYENGNPQKEEKYQYDVKQNPIKTETTTYDELGNRLNFLSEQLNEKKLVVVRIYEDFVLQTYEHTILSYNDAGIAQQQTVFDRNGNTLRTNILDELGRVVSETTYQNGVETEFIEYNYDENSRVIQESRFRYATGERSNFTYTYDQNGTLKTKSERDDNGQVLNVTTYDEVGLATQKVDYDPVAGTVLGKTVYAYDNTDRLVSSAKYDAANALLYTIMYYYRNDGSYYTQTLDADGNPIDGQNPDVENPGGENTDEGTTGGEPTDNTNPGTSTDSGTTTDSSTPSDTSTAETENSSATDSESHTTDEE